MSRENVGIVRALFEAYLRGDYDEGLTCLDLEGVYEVGQEVPALGPEAVRAVWERWQKRLGGARDDPGGVPRCGRRVVVAVH
jgi:ketosteroid isomerase-like protein